MNQCTGGICGLVFAATYITQPGDSGAPWFSGTTAHGIHYGGPLNTGGANRSIYTGISNVAAYLSAAVSTG